MKGSMVDCLMDDGQKSRRGGHGGQGCGLVAAALVSLLFVCQARATTYYVDKATGSDSRAGTSTSTAWATIGKANATLRAGDTVFIRAGTYNEIIEPYQSGTAGAPITYQNYSGETVVVRGEAGKTTIVALGVAFRGPTGPKSYIVVDGFTLRHVDPKSVSRPILVYISNTSSRYNVIRNCKIEAQGTGTWKGGTEDAVYIYGAKYNLLENNHISGWPRLGIYFAGIAQYNTVRGNTILNCHNSNIDFASSKGTMQYNVIEGNIIDFSLVEDGIQFENDYSLPAGTIDDGSNRGVLIRNNVFANAAENAIDTKGAAYLIIENNYFYGQRGNNDGGLNPNEGNVRYYGAHTIKTGGSTSSRNIIIRGNVIYDGPGGIEPQNYYKIYNNSILYNNRDYTGTNSTWTSTYRPTFAGIAAWAGKTALGIKNNIIGGHHAADVLIGRSATTLEIDGNLYFNEKGALLVDFRGNDNWSLIPFSQWPSFLASQGVQGTDARSLQAWPLFVNVPANPTGSHTKYNFNLQSGSPAIDKGVFLTTTTSSGQGTSLPVKDAGYFFDGWGIVSGDVIQLQGQTATARITSISSNTLVLDRSLSWSSGQGVALPYSGSAPDIGAREYGGTSSPVSYTLQVSAANGTVTKNPNKTSYSSGESVTLEATPSAGYMFTGWSGDLAGTTNPATLVMNGNKSVTANFAAVTYTLTISATNGTVTKTPNKTSYTAGETVTLQATPSTGYTFAGWSGALTGTANPATLVMDSNKTVTANFTASTITYTLSVSAANGTVSKTPNKTSYATGETVTLEATPSTGYVFTGWSGDLTGMTNPATLAMTANKSVTANFVSATTTYTLSVSATNGTVTRTPNKTSYAPGETVTLEAIPNTGYAFSGWSGALTGTANPATLVMDSNKSVTAGFTVASTGTTYYINRATGNDNNDGKSPTTAWNSIGKLNTYTGFVAGDRILLHRGHVWREQLIVPVSGTAGKPLVIGTYNTGNRPLLKGSAWMTTWTSAGTNQWQAAQALEPNQVFFQGERGTKVASQANLTGARQWFWSGGVLYVYATSNPSSTTTPVIEVSVRPTRGASGLVHVEDRQYVIIEGLEITQSVSHGIYLVNSGQHITVKDCDVNRSLDGGIVAAAGAAPLSQVTLENCLVHRNNGAVQEGVFRHEAITMKGIDGFAIRGCQVYENYGLGVCLKNGSANGVVENCRLQANALLNVYFDGATDVKVRYNRIADCTWDAGLKFGLETSTHSNDTIEVSSNLFWGNANGISFTAAAGVTAQTRNIHIRHNTFYNQPAAIRWKSTATDCYSGTNHIQNNIVWQQSTTNAGIVDEITGQQGIARTTIAHNAFQQGALSDTTGTNARLIADPLFVNPSSYDFHLQAGSPCIDAGTNVGLTTDFEGTPMPQGSAPDLGAYESAAPTAYSLQVSATNGTVARNPNKTSYSAGETVTLEATASTGYTFAGWSGDLTGTTNPTTLVMNGNKTVTANFTAVAPMTYTLTLSATNGTVTKTPNKTSYTAGETVSLQATPNTGYTFTGWSGALTGTANPAALVMDSNKAVTANFTAVTYTLSVSATNGTITRTPSKTSYTAGEAVTLQATPNTGYTFAGWSGDLTGTTNPATLVMNANKTVAAGFVKESEDRVPPAVGNCSPTPDTIQAPRNTLVVLHLTDAGQGVDPASVSIRVNGAVVYTGDVDSLRTEYGVCHRSGTKADYAYSYQPHEVFGCDRRIEVAVQARDLAGNIMPEYKYAFVTEMYAFGANLSVTMDQASLAQGQPTTVRDAQGNLWIVWQAGAVGSRQIYVANFRPEVDTYSSSVQVSYGSGDHCNPAVAIDGSGILYVVWQKNAGARWDLYNSMSLDGKLWSAPKPVVPATNDPVGNRTHPVMAAAGNLVAVAWQEDRAGNQDLWVARSTDRFQTVSVSQATSDTADQTQPTLAIDSQGTITLLWTDARNGGTDLYGAASNQGPWTNVPVVQAAGNQSQPAVAAGSTGRTLHLAWVDDTAGNLEVFYATSDGLPASPLTGISIIDDASGADQQMPVVALPIGADGTDQVFVCWTDGRNVAVSGDTDLYCAELSPGALRTNVLIGDDGIGVDPYDAVLGIDGRGYLYVLWADQASGLLQLYYAGVTYASPVPLAEQEIVASVGGIVGVPQNKVTSLDDVSVVIPAQASPFNARISIARIYNPQGFATESLRHYEFGPSGLRFAQPVTITIPYSVRGTGTIKAYWFDAVTGSFRDEGVTDVQDINLKGNLRALQFKTTHFTPFYLLPAQGSDAAQGGKMRASGVPTKFSLDTLRECFRAVRSRLVQGTGALQENDPDMDE